MNVNAKIDAALRKLQGTLQSNFKKVGGGAKFFTNTNKRGEGAELQSDLNSNDKERQKNAVKRIIANMTLGKDVSQLFTDVVKLGQTLNLALKKLVYLYVLNTAKLQPEKALMAVNTFLMDSTHNSPIVRSLAIRTMMSIRVECVMEYTLEPLRKALVDKEPYVRKTAALAIGKLFHLNSRLFYEQGFLQDLITLLSDTVPIVASNAAIVLSEVKQFAPQESSFSPGWCTKLLGCLSDSTEWGQAYILEFISSHTPSSPEEAETIVERVVPRLCHGNPAVVLGAIKVMVIALQKCASHKDTCNAHLTRINSALLTLAKTDPETQYVVLRNIHLLLELYPSMLANNLDTFFIRFSDPAYVKFEKLKLLLKLMNQKNAAQVIGELKEYSTEVDALFVREVIYTVASAVVKVDTVTQKGIQLLLNVAANRHELLADILNASKNIVRKYPEVFLDLVVPLIKEYGADAVEDEDAKVSFVWMLGEFCDLIEDGHELLQRFLSTFHEQEVAVQLALVTAVVKVFLRNPVQVEPTLQRVLQMATEETDLPDLRDRAYLYWRLLAENIGVEKMKQIVHGRKQPIEMEHRVTETLTVSEIRHSLNTAAAVYAKPSRSFLPPYGSCEMQEDQDDEEDEMEASNVQSPTEAGPPPSNGAAQQSVDPFDFQTSQTTRTKTSNTSATHVDPLDSIFSAGPTGNATAVKPPADALEDMFSTQPSKPSVMAQPTTLPPLVVDPLQANGLAIHATLNLDAEPVTIHLAFVNRGATPVSGFAMQFNKNMFGFVPAESLSQALPPSIAINQSVDAKIAIRVTETHFDADKSSVQIGVKCSSGLFTFFLSPVLTQFLSTPPSMSPAEFAPQWKAMDPALEKSFSLSSSLINKFYKQNAGQITSLLGRHRIHVVAHRNLKGQDNFYGCFKTHTGITSLFELVIARDAIPVSVSLSVKGERSEEMGPILQQVLEKIAEKI